MFGILEVGFCIDSSRHKMTCTLYKVPIPRVYNRKKGEYPTTLWYCVTTLSRVHDLWSDIHMLEVSQFAVCGHAS